MIEFFIGFIIGGLFGIILIAMCSAAKDDNDYYNKE